MKILRNIQAIKEYYQAMNGQAESFVAFHNVGWIWNGLNKCWDCWKFDDDLGVWSLVQK